MKYRPFEELFEAPIRNGLTKPKNVRGEGYKMINMGEIFRFSRIKNVQMDRVPLSDKEKATSMVRTGDLLFARQSLVRDGAGKCSIFLGDDEDVCFESHLIRCRLNNEISNPLFYYYYFSSRLGNVAIDAIVEQGAGAAGIRGSDLAKVLVPDVEKSYQDKIAKILDQLDFKIELNDQINQTLELLAQVIFKSWFINFEPVKAKMAVLNEGGSCYEAEQAAIKSISGINDAGLAQLKEHKPESYIELTKIAAMFPSTMQESDLGNIPEGWTISEIGKEATVVGGATPSTRNNQFWDGGSVNWATPKDLSDLREKVLIETGRKITEKGLKKISSGLLPPDTVLMSSRAPVGYLAIVKVPVAINQGFIAMKCNKVLSPEYVLQWCESQMEEIKQRASGTTFAEISKKNFNPIPVIVPTHEAIEKYTNHVKLIYSQIENNIYESRTLSQLKESLLPKLLSGEIELIDEES